MGATTVEVSSNFKMTEKCLLPEDWDVVTLEDVCVKAINGGTPSTEVEKYWGGDIPWITGADILNQKVSKIRRYITEEAVRNSSTNVIPKGNLLVVTRTGVGKLAIAPFDVAVSQDFTGIIPTETIKTEFLFWLLNNSANYFLDLTQGTSINGITRKDLMRFVFPLPPLPEQHQIAAILSTIDSAIEQTEAIIAKQQRIKTGLMQDLLTRGIDEHGNIRSEETHEFKDSPLGRIPVEWEAPIIDELTVRVGSGVTPRGGESVYTKEGVLFIRSQNVHFGGLLLADVSYISQKIHDTMKRSEVFENDVLLNITGASIGRCCPMPAINCTANVNQHVCAIRLSKATQSDAGFLTAVIESSIGQNQILQFNAGGNREGLNYQQVRSFVIPWPKAEERQRLHTVIKKSAEALKVSGHNLEKLHSLKTALMQGLLTGKKRVTALLNDTEEITS